MTARLTRRSFLATVSAAAFVGGQADAQNSRLNFSPFNIGAGGWVVGADIALSDNTTVINTDTGGAYWHNGTNWIQLVTMQSMPAGIVGMSAWPHGVGPFDPTGGYRGGFGVYAIAVAPSNTNRAYMMFAGRVYRTDNLKLAPNHSWILTGYKQKLDKAGHASGVDPNGQHVNPVDEFASNRGGSQKLAVDPVNADVVYVGIGDNHGVFRSDDAGVTWAPVTGIINGTANNYISFDPSSAATGTPARKSRVLIASYGTGVYESTDRGTKFTLLTGGASYPTLMGQMFVDSTGVIWCTDLNAGKIWKCTAGAWAVVASSNGGQQYRSIAENPIDGSIYCILDGGSIVRSTDKATFKRVTTGYPPSTITAADIPWLAATNESYISVGRLLFDNSGKMLLSEGIGFFETKSPLAKQTVWESRSLGIEQLVANQICVPPDGNPIFTAWDRPVFRGVVNPNAFPPGHGINYKYPIQIGNGCDWASFSPLTIVTNGFATAGKSLDGGQTWSPYGEETIAPVDGGCIAASSALNYVAVSSGSSGDPYSTTDGGNSWTMIIIPGIPHGNRIKGAANNGSGLIRLTVDSTAGWKTDDTHFLFGARGAGLIDNPYKITVIDETHLDLQGTIFAGATAGGGYIQDTKNPGWHPGSYFNSRMLVADRGTPGTYYMYSWLHGTFKSSDGGASWKLASSKIFPNSNGNSKMRSVFGRAGHIVFSAGDVGGSPPFGSLYFTQNGLLSDWVTIPNVRRVVGVGFGAAAPSGGTGYPTCYIAGWVSQNSGASYSYGIWQSVNFDQPKPTWTKLTDYPAGNFDAIKDLDGDPSRYGVCYLGHSGSGWSWCH